MEHTPRFTLDKLYDRPSRPAAFRFDARVADAFPDMIARSVPGYEFNLELVAALAQRYVQDHSCVYDLGCSLGAMTLSMRSALAQQPSPPDDVQFIGVDASTPMIERAQGCLHKLKSDYQTRLICADLLDISLTNASMVVLGYTLQFIQPEQRVTVIQRIYQGLNPGGVLVLAEKLAEPDPASEQLLVELHHDFKRANGYSELEIAQKRQALENVLVCDSEAQHRSRLAAAGFSPIVLLSKHYQFALFLAQKPTETNRP